jgi:hypothetical protein
MPEIEIELEPIAEGQAELAREIGQLEAGGKRILDIRYPGWAADDLGIIPDAQTGNAGQFHQKKKPAIQAAGGQCHRNGVERVAC